MHVLTIDTEAEENISIFSQIRCALKKADQLDAWSIQENTVIASPGYKALHKGI
jgi:hypothetical protein